MHQPEDVELTEQLAELMGLHVGDTFVWVGAAFQVEDIDTRMDPRDRDSLTVSDPTVSHPQDGRYGNWGVPLWDVFEAWLVDEVSPGRVVVES